MTTKSTTHRLRKIVVYTFLIVFLLPVVVRAGIYLVSDHPASWRDADWSSSGLLLRAAADHEIRTTIPLADVVAKVLHLAGTCPGGRHTPGPCPA